MKMLLLKLSTVLNFDLCGPEKSEENYRYEKRKSSNLARSEIKEAK